MSYKRGLMKHWSDKVGSFFDGNKRPGNKIYLQIDHVKARRCFIVVISTSIVFVIICSIISIILSRLRWFGHVVKRVVDSVARRVY